MSREPALVTVKVSTGTQLSFDGTTYVSGAEIEAPEDIAERWIVRGWAEPLEPRPPKPASGSTRADVPAAGRGRSARTR